jgi:AcrR family transcriptional regulator
VARPPTVDKEEILAAAREVLREHGVRATTAQVAERAGISEGSIFNRFPTKRALFRAAVEPMFGAGAWTRTLQKRVGATQPPEQLVEIGLEIAKFFRSLMPIIIVSIAEAGGPEDAPPPAAIAAEMKRLGDYFRAEADAGRMRPHDSLTVARIFIGAIFHFVFVDVTLDMGRELPLGTDAYLRGLVDTLWRGLAPADGSRAAQRTARSKHRSK